MRVTRVKCELRRPKSVTGVMFSTAAARNNDADYIVSPAGEQRHFRSRGPIQLVANDRTLVPGGRAGLQQRLQSHQIVVDLAPRIFAEDYGRRVSSHIRGRSIAHTHM